MALGNLVNTITLVSERRRPECYRSLALLTMSMVLKRNCAKQRTVYEGHIYIDNFRFIYRVIKSECTFLTMDPSLLLFSINRK